MASKSGISKTDKAIQHAILLDMIWKYAVDGITH
jgi:hypothetical protein